MDPLAMEPTRNSPPRPPIFRRRVAAVGVSMLLLAGSLAVHAQSGTQVLEFATPAPILASPTVSPDGVTYLGSYDRKIYALAATGEVLWVTPLPPPDYIYFAVYAGIYGTPALGADGTVYLPSENGKLLALDPANGAVKWTYAPAQVEGL